MRKIALMTLLNREDSSLSPHFGKAKWIMIRDLEHGPSRFLQNHGLNGKSVVEQLQAEHCTDVICSEIGMGAVENLQRAQIRGWLAPAGVAAPLLVEMLVAGSLQPVSATHQHRQDSGRHSSGAEHSGGGCCCGHRHGNEQIHDGASGCCHS